MGNFGLIRRYGEDTIYEGYVGQFSARKRPCFDARVDILDDAREFQKPLREGSPKDGTPTPGRLQLGQPVAAVPESVAEGA